MDDDDDRPRTVSQRVWAAVRGRRATAATVAPPPRTLSEATLVYAASERRICIVAAFVDEVERQAARIPQYEGEIWDERIMEQLIARAQAALGYPCYPSE